MNAVLKYGEQSSITLDIARDALVAHHGKPSAAPVEDPAAAVVAALAEPIDFPALDRAIAPGDRVAIALDSDLPCQAQLVAGAVRALLEAGVEAQDITLVRCADASHPDDDDLRQALPDDIRNHVKVSNHDPAERDDLGYLAASAKGDPIYINRGLWEADIVLPIGCLRVDLADDSAGAFATVYPALADESSQKRDRAAALDSLERRQQRRHDADEAGRWLGVLMAIQVIPGEGDSVIQVLAGEVQATYDRGRALCEEHWRFGSPHRASLVIAGIEGGASVQTWDNIGRALASAAKVVEDSAPIVICSKVTARPGAALQQLSQIDDIDEAFRLIRKQRSADAAVAAELLRVSESHQVFLLSDLENDLVENLGIIPIEDDTDVGRLAARHPSCTLISNAHLSAVSVEDVCAEDDIEAASHA